MKFKFFLIIILAVILFSVSFSAKALTPAEIQAKITELKAQINQLYAQLTQLMQDTSVSWCHTFNVVLQRGSTGLEVAALQVALQKQGFSISSSESTSQTFGDSTFLAVKNFQEKYASDILFPLGLTQGTGKVAARTLAKLNQLYGCGAKTIPTVCTPNWSCFAWRACQNSQQTRTCADSNNCGTITGKPATTRSCTSGATCNPNWQCTAWRACQNSQQTRTCADSNNCGVTTNRPNLSQSCTLTCSPNWQCSSWSSCVNSQQTKTCADSNNCGLTTGKPATTQSCTATCSPDWSCSSWSDCLNSQQTRSCYDSNYCGITTGAPSQTQSCVSACAPNWSCSAWSTCVNSQQTKSCTDLNNCGVTTNRPNLTQSCTATCSPNCADSRQCGDDGCGGSCGTCPFDRTCEVNSCVIIGGSANSPSWMCAGNKYRQNPDVSWADWQEFVNGAWTSNLSSCVAQPEPACKETYWDCQDSLGHHPASCYSNFVIEKYVCENEKCVLGRFICLGGTCKNGGCENGVYPVKEYCSDSDSGEYYFMVKGQCQDALSGNYIRTDYCADVDVLTEYYCGYQAMLGSAYGCVAEQVRCPAGCQDGVCLP